MEAKNITLEALYNGIQQVQHKLDQLTEMLADDGELSEETLEALNEARETPESEYVKLE